MNEQDELNFSQDIEKIGNYDSEMKDYDMSKDAKSIHEKAISGMIKALKKKYTGLDQSEQYLLKNLEEKCITNPLS